MTENRTSPLGPPTPPKAPTPPKPPKPPKTAPSVPKPPKPKMPAPAHWEGLKTWAEAEGEKGVEGERYDGDWVIDELLRRQTMALYDATAQFVAELKGAQKNSLSAEGKRTDFRQRIYARMARALRAKR